MQALAACLDLNDCMNLRFQQPDVKRTAQCLLKTLTWQQGRGQFGPENGRRKWDLTICASDYLIAPCCLDFDGRAQSPLHLQA